MGGVRWTDNDDALLRKMYPNESMSRIVHETKRSVYAIHGRAKELGISRVCTGRGMPVRYEEDGVGGCWRIGYGKRVRACSYVCKNPECGKKFWRAPPSGKV